MYRASVAHADAVTYLYAIRLPGPSSPCSARGRTDSWGLPPPEGTERNNARASLRQHDLRAVTRSDVAAPPALSAGRAFCAFRTRERPTRPPIAKRSIFASSKDHP